MNSLPSGTVTFLFTDIEGSTRLWEKHPEEMKSALAKHDSLLRGIFLMHNGEIVKKTGDGFHVVFATATDAVQAAIHSQQDYCGLRVISGLWELHSAFWVRQQLPAGTSVRRSKRRRKPSCWQMNSMINTFWVLH